MEKSPLSRLPPELRVRVYEYACPFSSESICLEEVNKHTALLQTCRSIYKEASPTFAVSHITKVTILYDFDTGPEEGVTMRLLRTAIRTGKLPNINIVDFYVPLDHLYHGVFAIFDVFMTCQSTQSAWLDETFECFDQSYGRSHKAARAGWVVLEGPDDARVTVPERDSWKSVGIDRFKRRS